MAVGLKTNGLETVESLRKRIRRQYSLRRISKHDHDVLIEKANDIEAYILKMDELDPKLEKLESDWKRII